SLIPDALALLAALGVGALATALAIRWRASVIAWIGLCGALLAPGVLGGGALPYLVVAYAATVAVLVWQRWRGLGVVAFVLAAVQWMAWLAPDERPVAAVYGVLAIFGALTVVAAVGFELRRRQRAVRPSAAALLILNAVALDAAGYLALDETSSLAANAL